jgi:predicted SAM-dependent methyltransferase
MEARDLLLGPARTLGRWLRSYPAVPIRRARSRGGARWSRWIPKPLAGKLDLDGREISPLKVELGCGPHPSPGYVHMDIDRSARHLEHVGPIWNLPFADESVEELLAIHVLEHVHPADLSDTLKEWHRVLAPGGSAKVHVPNAPEIFESFRLNPPDQKWALINALMGMYGGANISSPDDIAREFRSDHQAMYDFELLEHVLLEAGFGRVENLTGRVTDRHCEAWRGVVKDFSLIVRADKPGPD